MSFEMQNLRHAKEKVYGGLVYAAGAVLWLLIAGFIGAMIYEGETGTVLILVAEIAAFALLYGLAALFHRTWLYGHAVLIGPNQLPRVYESLKKGSDKLGLPEPPQAFLYNSHGLMNAFAMKVFGRRMVLLTSALIDVESDRQVDFVVAHELGHHVAGHLSFWKNIVKLPGAVVPFLGAAYHRSRELTADRIGAFCVEDVDTARSALHMLACGSARLNSVMNANAFAAQENEVPAVSGFLLHIVSSYPRLTRRVTEVEDFLAQRRFAPPLASGVPLPV